MSTNLSALFSGFQRCIFMRIKFFIIFLFSTIRKTSPCGRDLYCATSSVTRGLGFSGLIRRTVPFNRLLPRTDTTPGAPPPLLFFFFTYFFVFIILFYKNHILLVRIGQLPKVSSPRPLPLGTSRQFPDPRS
jgi:hypothetical protein